jgi:hypothetical protein
MWNILPLVALTLWLVMVLILHCWRVYVLETSIVSCVCLLHTLIPVDINPLGSLCIAVSTFRSQCLGKPFYSCPLWVIILLLHYAADLFFIFYRSWRISCNICFCMDNMIPKLPRGSHWT